MDDILIATGSGELGVMEFKVNGKFYGINVLKLKGIVQLDEIIGMPHRKPEVLGVSNIRNIITSVIDLRYVLENINSDISEKPLALLCEFNGINIAFLVDSVEGIRNLKWEDMGSDGNDDLEKITTGGFLIDGRILIMLDFESIVMETGLGVSYLSAENYEPHIEVSKERHILFAEDSALIAQKIKSILTAAGYQNVKYFVNGKEVYEYLLSLKEELGESFMQMADVLISDIEMPIMDGYTLTKLIKTDPILKKLPVVFFSSLVNDEISHKGASIGVDAQVCKPSAKDLVEVVERFVK